MIGKEDIEKQIINNLRMYLSNDSYNPKPGSLDEWLVKTISELDYQILTYMTHLFLEQSYTTAINESSLLRLAKLQGNDIKYQECSVAEGKLLVSVDNIDDELIIDKNISFTIDSIYLTPLKTYILSKIDEKTYVVKVKKNDNSFEKIDHSIIERTVVNNQRKTYIEFPIECIIGKYECISFEITEPHIYNNTAYVDLPIHENYDIMVTNIWINDTKAVYEPFLFDFSDKDKYYYSLDYTRKYMRILFSNGIYGKRVKKNDEVKIEYIKSPKTINLSRYKSYKVYNGINLELTVQSINHNDIDSRLSRIRKILQQKDEFATLITSDDIRDFLLKRFGYIVRKVFISNSEQKPIIRLLLNARISHIRKDHYVLLTRKQNDKYMIPKLEPDYNQKYLYELDTRYFCKLRNMKIVYDTNHAYHTCNLTVHTNLLNLKFNILHNNRALPKNSISYEKIDDRTIRIQFPIDEGQYRITGMFSSNKVLELLFEVQSLYDVLHLLSSKIYVHREDVSNQLTNAIVSIDKELYCRSTLSNLPMIEILETERDIDNVPIPLHIKVEVFDKALDENTLKICVKHAVDKLNDTHKISNSLLTHFVHKQIEQITGITDLVCECYILDSDGNPITHKLDTYDALLHTRDELIEIAYEG